MVPSLMTALEARTPVAVTHEAGQSRPLQARATSSATVEFSGSLRYRCAEVASTLPMDSGLTLTCVAMPERLPTAVATRLTVIAMELIATALSSFENLRGGRIEVLFIAMPAAWNLTVEHCGPRTAIASRREFAGAAVVRSLTTELGGRLDRRIMIGGERTVVTVPCSHAAPIRVPRLMLVPRLGGMEMDKNLGTSIEASAGKPTAPEAVPPTDEPLRESVENAVPEVERLPSGADENPISQRVREAGDEPTPPADRPTVPNGDRV